MDFGENFRSFMDTKGDGDHEFHGVDEDDVFYAEIRRQILLLTADDDEEDCYQEKRYKQGSSRGMDGLNFSSGFQIPGNYFTWGGNEKSDSVPIWMVNLWKSGNGTGVFIPNIVKTRRRNRPGRMNSERRKIFKPVQNKQL